MVTNATKRRPFGRFESANAGSQPSMSRRTRWRHHQLLLRRYRRRDEHFDQATEAEITAELVDAGGVPPDSQHLSGTRLSANDLTERELRRLLSTRYPVIVEGLDLRSEAVGRWSLSELSRRYPSAPVGTLAQRPSSNPAEPHYRTHDVADLSLADAVAAIGDGGDRYIAATAEIFGHHPELLTEVGLPRLRELLGLHVVRPELFIGNADHRSYFHCALGTNVFLQIVGEKDWTLVHPKYTPWMYPNIGHSASGLYIASPVRTESPTQAGDYPLYSLIPKIELRTRPGDVLINPSWWWHEVRNCGETIAVALRTPSIGRQNPLFSGIYFTNREVLGATKSIVTKTLRSRRGLVPDTDDRHRRTALYSEERLEER